MEVERARWEAEVETERGKREVEIEKQIQQVQDRLNMMKGKSEQGEKKYEQKERGRRQYWKSIESRCTIRNG